MVRRREIAGLVLATLVTACTTELTPQARQVRIVERSEVAGFQFVGEVQGFGTGGGANRRLAHRSAVNEALNQAASMGATHVVLTAGQSPLYYTVGQSVRGEAYRRQ